MCLLSCNKKAICNVTRYTRYSLYISVLFARIYTNVDKIFVQMFNLYKKLFYI